MFAIVHNYHAVHKRTCVIDSSQFNPLNITIRANSASVAQDANQPDLSNLVVYVTGRRPNLPPSPDTVSFIAQFHHNGNTTYFIPPDLPTGQNAQVLDTRRQDLELPVALAGTSFTTPGAVVSGRIYIAQNGLHFSLGPEHLIIPPDPNNPGSLAYTNRNSFIEFTHTSDDVTVNLSFVDMVSLALGFNLTFYDGDEQTTRSVPGLKPDGLGHVCDGLALLGGFWPNLCVRDKHQNPLHVISPSIYYSLFSADLSVGTYYDDYINQVWDKYMNNPLKLNLQGSTAPGSASPDNLIITCQVDCGDMLLHCDHNTGTFAKPTTADIWGCASGPFANPRGTVWTRERAVPILCAAFVRSTIHLDGTQPSDIPPYQFYQHNITHHYARLVHENLIEDMGYAFSYDDVTPDANINTAGLVSGETPTNLDIFINI